MSAHEFASEVQPSDLFLELSSLEYLNLNYNRFDVLEDDFFKGLGRLEALLIGFGGQYFNERTEPMKISNRAFSHLPSLQRLSMTHNRILHLPDFVFSQLKNLEVVDFTDVKFSQEVSAMVFAPIAYSKKAYTCLWGARFSRETMDTLMDQLGHRYNWWDRYCPR